MTNNSFVIKIGRLVLESDGSHISFRQVQLSPSNGIQICSAGQTFQELSSNLESILKISNGRIEISNGTIIDFTDEEKKIIAKVSQLLKVSKDTLEDLRLLATNCKAS